MNYWLIVDTVRIPNALNQVSKNFKIDAVLPLFITSDFDYMIEQSPLLFNLGQDDSILTTWATLPLYDSSSIIFASLQTDGYELLEHLHKLLIVDIDNRPMLFRFYTNKIWEKIGNKLNEDDINTILGKTSEMYWIDHNKEKQKLVKNATTHILNEERIYKLTSPVFKEFVQ